jgi:ABC-2 type transport system ATP-binding protein
MRSVARLAAWLVTAAAAALAAPSLDPADPSLHPVGEALAFGGVAGAGLFAVLARRPVRAAAVAAAPRRRLLARSTVLAVRSVQEEAVWRGLVLGLLAGAVGRVGALALSSALFASAHARSQGRAAAAHVATGSVFGASYLATGRLLAAVTAHGTYNILAGAAALTEPGVSVSDTGEAAKRRLASTRPRPPARTSQETPIAQAVPQVAARLDGVVKSFGPTRALDEVDLELRAGEVVALLGANGAGKSTAVAVMLGLRRPDAGRAWLREGDPRDPVSRRRVGAVLQDVGFPATLRVREIVDLVRAHYPAPCSAEAALDRLGLSGAGRRQAVGLSGGQQRRLAVALALAGRPEVLFLDEPTAGMDAGARRALLRDLAAFAAEGGAVLLTTQQLAEAEDIASRVVLLSRGKVALDGTVAEVRARAGTTRVTFRAERIPPLAGISSSESHLDRHVVFVTDADVFVAALVRSGVPFSDLRVTPVSLEDAFVTLTQGDHA